MKLGQRRLPLEFLSASSLSKAVSCPELWRRRYLLHEKEGFGVDRFFGSVDHATIAGYMDDKKRNGLVWSVEQLMGAYAWCWDDELKKAEDHGEPAEWGITDPKKLSDSGKLLVDAYVKQAADLVDPIAIESRFEEKLPGIPIPVIGYIDLETPDRIVERKTAKKRVSAPQPNWRFQGRIYQLAQRKPVSWHVSVRKVHPEVITDLSLPVGNPDQTVVLIQQIYRMLEGFWQRYGSRSPWPTTGTLHPWLCGKCGFGPSLQASCVAWRDQ